MTMAVRAMDSPSNLAKRRGAAIARIALRRTHEQFGTTRLSVPSCPSLAEWRTICNERPNCECDFIILCAHVLCARGYGQAHKTKDPLIIILTENPTFMAGRSISVLGIAKESCVTFALLLL